MRRARWLAGVAAASAAAALAGAPGGPPTAAAGPGEILVRLREGAEEAPAVPLLPRLDAWLARDATRSLDPQRIRSDDAARAALAAAVAAPLLPTGAAPPLAFRSADPAAAELRARLARTYAIRLAPGFDIVPLLGVLAALEPVEWVSPIRAIPLSTTTAAPTATTSATATDAAAGGGDPLRSEQWYLDRVGVEDAWAVTRGRPDILVAIVDTGVLQHEDLLSNLWINDDPPGNANPDDDAVDQDQSGTIEDWEREDDDDNGYVDDTRGYDFVDAPRIGGPGDAVERDNDVTDDSGHGTAMAGVIAAVAENGLGMAGLAPGCTVMPVRAGFNPGLGPFSGVLEEDDAAAAIVYAAENGARVINMSWGDTLLSPVVGDAIAYARELGTVLVASAGNLNFDGMHYPSGLPGVLATGASNPDDSRSPFSNFGAALDLLAPGSGILVTVGESDYSLLSGTSLAAPLVSAASALVLSRDPALRAPEVASIVFGSTADLGWPGWDAETGHGRLDAGRAVAVTRSISVAIHAPAAGTGVDREAPVVVTAEGLRLESYTVEVGAGRNPASFTLLAAANGRQVVEDTVAVWQAQDLPAGEYTFRLRVRDEVEGLLEERALVVVDHTDPTISEESVTDLWVEDRLVPFVFFTTDDLARGAIDMIDQQGDPRRIDEAFLTQDHVLRLPEDLAPGDVVLTLSATNAAGLTGVGTAPVSATIASQRAHTYSLTETATRLSGGELAPRPADLDGDGDLDQVLMADEPGFTFGPLLVYSATGDDAYAESDTLPHRLLPRDVGDTDGDGRMEILASGRATACLLESPGPLAYPTAKVWEDAGGFGIGFAELADGPAILAIKSDSLLVYRSTGDASAWSRTAVINFTPGRRSLAPTFFAGDVDGDGAVEVVIGDAGGNLLAYRDPGAGALEPAYSLRLPEAINPLVTGGDLNGDSRPEIVVDLPADLDLASEALLERRRHLILVLTAQPNGFSVIEGLGVAGAERFRNAVRVASVDADPEGEILVAAAPDFYVFDRIAGSLFPTFYRGGVGSATLAVGDGDGDGRVEVFVRAGTEVLILEGRDSALPGPLPPDGLRARFLAGGGVEVAWNSGAPLYRLYRAAGSAVDCAGAQLLVELPESTYQDTTAVNLVEITYRVSAVEAGVEGECSRPLTLVRSEAPVVLAAVPEHARRVRVTFSTAMDPSADRLESYRLLDPSGAPHALSSVLAAGEGRERILVLARGLERPGPHRLLLGALRSAAGVPLAGEPEVGFDVPAGLPPPSALYIESALGVAGAEVRLRLSAPPDSVLGENPASYRLSGGFVIAEVEMEQREVRLLLDPGTPLRPGIFRVGLAPELRGAADERVVPGQGDETDLVIGGELVAFPNPYDSARALSDGVNLVGLAAGDRVILLDALGREILRIDARNSGSAFIPVRGNPLLPSGVYLYRVEGPSGSRVGKLAIRR